MEKTLYLTFDDGPDAQYTEQILSLLRRKNCKATFFCVAERAKAHRSTVEQMVKEGHAIGNHSLDHRYRYYFASDARLENWILDADKMLTEIAGIKPIGFRPPAGVVTPPLKRVLARTRIPLVMWSHRFFDGVFSLSLSRLLRAASSAPNGAIFLLHDRGVGKDIPMFEKFLDLSRAQGISFHAIS